MQNLFNSKKLGEKDYDELNNKIDNTPDKAREIHINEEEKLIEPFEKSLFELIKIYKNIQPLLTVNSASFLKRTFVKEIPRPKSWYARYSMSGKIGSGAGGHLTIFLFRRRVKKVFDDIITTSYICLNYEQNPAKINNIKEVIEKVASAQRNINAMTKRDAPNKTDLLLKIIPIALTLIAPGILTTYFTPIVLSMPSISMDLPILFYIAELIYVILLFFVIKYVH